jgi:soluble lytic murein transglycosylase-like protein
MNRNTWIWLGGAGLVLWALSRTQTATDLTESGVDTVTAALSGWKAVQQGPYWVPIINQVEQVYGIPADLLARIAYQESRFRPEIIEGTKVSSAGALGLMQLMPHYFTSVQRARPFSPDDTLDQINEAAHLLQGLYNHFGDWGLAVMGYNDGQTNIDHYVAGTHALPQQTADYLTQVLSDVPVATAVTLA